MNKRGKITLLVLVSLFIITLFGIFVYANSITTSDKYKVSFEFSKEGIIEKCLDIQIDRLDVDNTDISMDVILNETNFDINSVDN